MLPSKSDPGSPYLGVKDMSCQTIPTSSCSEQWVKRSWGWCHLVWSRCWTRNCDWGAVNLPDYSSHSSALFSVGFLTDGCVCGHSWKFPQQLVLSNANFQHLEIFYLDRDKNKSNPFARHLSKVTWVARKSSLWWRECSRISTNMSSGITIFFQANSLFPFLLKDHKCDSKWLDVLPFTFRLAEDWETLRLSPFIYRLASLIGMLSRNSMLGVSRRR